MSITYLAVSPGPTSRKTLSASPDGETCSPWKCRFVGSLSVLTNDQLDSIARADAQSRSDEHSIVDRSCNLSTRQITLLFRWGDFRSQDSPFAVELDRFGENRLREDKMLPSPNRPVQMNAKTVNSTSISFSVLVRIISCFLTNCKNSLLKFMLMRTKPSAIMAVTAEAILVVSHRIRKQDFH